MEFWKELSQLHPPGKCDCVVIVTCRGCFATRGACHSWHLYTFPCVRGASLLALLPTALCGGDPDPHSDLLSCVCKVASSSVVFAPPFTCSGLGNPVLPSHRPLGLSVPQTKGIKPAIPGKAVANLQTRILNSGNAMVMTYMALRTLGIDKGENWTLCLVHFHKVFTKKEHLLSF